MFAFFANLFGYLLNFLYNLLQNYGLSIILFSIIVKIVLLPISIKQQKTMKKTARVQEEVKKLQIKNKNNPEALSRETMELYKRENMNPFGGCFTAIVQIVLLISVFYLVKSPLTYMKKVDPELIEKYTNEINNAKISEEQDESNKNSNSENEENNPNIENNDEIKQENTDSENTENNNNDNIENNQQNSENTENNHQENNDEKEDKKKKEKKPTDAYPEITIIREKSAEDENVYINMEFLGLDLSSIPQKDFEDWRTYVIPVLYVISTFISIKITTSMQKKQKKETDIAKEGEGLEGPDMMNQMNRNMTFMMPILAVSVSLVAPLGLALYWLTNNIIMIVERLLLNIFIKDKEEETNA